MLDQIFGRFLSSQWIVFASLLILLVGLSESAWRMGFARSRKKSEADKDSGTVRSAVLALLGLLLGFSFAIAGARHEARRELLVEEANSIGTTARRAQLLPEPHAANVAQLLREYVPLRIDAHREAQFSDQFATTRKRSADLQDRMWAEAVAAAAERPSPITASFIASLNETIDLEGTRIAAKRNHVPGAVWLLLLCVTGCGLWLVSYQAGTSGRHSILERFVFPILIAIVIAIITDIDTPRGGLVSLDERPLLELNETLSRASATTTP
jgi:protein-S-isoprenylcysteine O-methyltransferase Ste14